MNPLTRVLALLALLFTGCGESDPESGESTNPQTPEVAEPGAGAPPDDAEDEEFEKLALEDEPDLDDPEVLERVLGEAVLRETLEERGPEGAKLFYVPGSETPFTGWAKRVYGNGQPEALGHTTGGKGDGRSIAWHDNGQKKLEVTYKDGKPEGPYTVWHDNGQTEEKGTYKDGKEEGLATAWDEDGNVIDQTHFKNGEPFHEDDPNLDDPAVLAGILAKAVLWDSLERREGIGEILYFRAEAEEPYTGFAKMLHDNGQLALLGSFKDGEPSGLWTWWDEDGEKEDEKRY